MKRRAMQPCLDCRRPTFGRRCEKCTTAYEATRHNAAYDTPEWRATRARILSEWRAKHGNLCPGVPGEHAPHHDADLTVDHVTRLADGGALTGQPLRVMCREWNGRLGARSQS